MKNNSALIKKELWFAYFTETLYKERVISEDKKIELEKRISLFKDEEKEVV